ncbi:hypothetical protein LguiA_007566 [Lonicera macranthoides]
MKNKGKGKSKNSGKAHKQQQPKSKNNDPFNNIINTDLSIWGEKNEEVLEKKLRGKVEILFEGVLNELVSKGYTNEVARNALVLNGHVFYGMSLFNNIMNNSIAFINEGRIDQECRISEHVPTTWKERVSDLQELLIFLAQRGHPSWTKSDAMKFLMATNLQVNPPISTDFSSFQEKMFCAPEVLDQFVQDPRVKHTISQLLENLNGKGISVLGEYRSISSDTCNSNTNTSTIDSSPNVDLFKKINFTLELEAHLEENVSKLVTAFKREMGESSTNSTCLLDSFQINEPKRTRASMDEEDESYLSLVEEGIKYGPDHPKNHSIMSAVSYTRELKEKLKERKEWANKKFVQAAQRLSCTLVELKFLKLERFVRERTTFQDKERLQDKFFDKKICEKDGILKKVSTQLECVNEHVRRLELMNSTYMANSEANKLSYTEYRVKGLDFVKMEKKLSKRVTALRKLCSELEEQLLEDKAKEIALSEEAIQVKKAIQEDEENLREELKQKELITSRVSEENKLNKAVDSGIKRNQAMLSQKLEIDFQLMKDEKRRLEEELSHIKRSADSSHLLFEGTSRTHAFDVDIFADAMPLESLTLQDSSTNEGFKSRKCITCSKSEALVLFLPCAHQVTCVNCNKMSDFAGTSGNARKRSTRTPNAQVS